VSHRLTTLASTCPACGAANTAAWVLDYASFRHLDFAPLGTAAEWPNTIAGCHGCGILYRLLDAGQRQAIATLYGSRDYAEHQEDHMVRSGENMRHACEVQADSIVAQWPQAAAARAILDIGCFDGKLLAALAARSAARRLVGYDVAPRPGFPSTAGFEFHSGDRATLDGGFDLILLSQSMIYIGDLDRLFAEFTTLLNPDGCIFVHVPNSAIRPSSLLLGDQIFYFTPDSLQTLFARHGYGIEFASQDSFRRDILLLARRSAGASASTDTCGNEAVLRQLDAMADSLRAIPGDRLAILGTTIEAAFAHSLIAERVSVFVDENPNKLGRPFNGKPVVAPAALPDASTCIVPMGSAAKDLAARLGAHYRSRFVAV
jgi:SAM-dependent methyltransferase